MGLWRDLSIRNKILAAIATVIAALMAVGVLAILEMASMNAKATDIRDNWLPSIVQLGKIERAVTNFRLKEAHQLIAFSAHAEAAVAEAAADVDRAYEDYKPLISAGTDDARLMKAFAELWPKFKASAQHTLAIARNGDAAAAMIAFDSSDFAAKKAVADLLLRDIDFNESQGRKAADAGEATYRASRATLIVGLLLGATLGGLAGFALIFGLVRPIGRTTLAIERLAEGDLAASVTGTERRDEIGSLARALDVFKKNMARGRDLERQATLDQEDRVRQQAESTARESRMLHVAEESRQKSEAEALAHERSIVVGSIGAGLARLAEKDLTCRLSEQLPPAYRQLQDDFNAAVGQLAAAFERVNASTDVVQSGSREIAEASGDLSRRAEQQAASLEETAAALDQITVTVKKTAEGAKLAQVAVSIARGDAQRGGEIVRKAVDAMGKIEKSSRQISQIIGVIDEIAFQTNLLALNAGVEAARAGDAGRGFAVVASEVRALAQRSAEAAKEIKGLISSSTAQVGEGVGLVGETGKALEQIEHKVTEITSVVAEISTSAQEQAAGLQQVNAAVNKMDQSTQQNAAMSEQATAASQSLAQETGRLVSMIAEFNIGRPVESDIRRKKAQRRSA